MWIVADLARLPTIKIGKENEAAHIYALQQHRANERAPVAPSGGEAHCGWLDNTGNAGVLQPVIKLCNRVGIKIFATQPTAAIVGAHLGNIHHKSYLTPFDSHRLDLRCHNLVLTCKLDPETQERAVLDGRIAAGILVLSGRPILELLRAQLLVEHPVTVALPKSHPQAVLPEISLPNLKEQPFIGLHRNLDLAPCLRGPRLIVMLVGVLFAVQ